MADEARGTLEISFAVHAPAERSDYHRTRGDVELRQIAVGSWACTEAEGVKIAEHFRVMNATLRDATTIVWTGPRKL